MQSFSYQGLVPFFNNSNFIASGAKLIGQVHLGEFANIWFNCVLRGDVNKIIIGKNTNIQDLSILHVTEEFDLNIGANVTIGHCAILHGCQIEDGCLIGMGAKILDGAVIGEKSLVAAGSIVPPGKKYPAGSMIMGSPAVVVRKLKESEIHSISNHYKSYTKQASVYLSESVKEIP